MKLVLPQQKRLIASPLYSETSEPPYMLQLVEADPDAYTPIHGRPQVGAQVYSDLLAYSFALQVQHIAARTEKTGVVRIRRTAAAPFPVADDLYALERLFGTLQHVTVRTRTVADAAYTIVLCRFGAVMAHVEYKVGAARIEFEWSHEAHIVEFDSAAMHGDADNNRTLDYNLDAILVQAHVFSADDAARYDAIVELIKGGDRR